MRRRFAVLAVIGCCAVLPAAAANASSRGGGTRHPQSACRISEKRFEGDTDYYSSCFPTMNVNVAWSITDNNGQGTDNGTGVGTWALDFTVDDKGLVSLEAEPSTSLNDEVEYNSQVTADDGCGLSQPPFDQNGKGSIESGNIQDGFYPWEGNVPTQTTTWYPNLQFADATITNCLGNPVPLDYSPGHILDDSTCPAAGKESSGNYYAPYQRTGTIAGGVTDKWDLTCDYVVGPDRVQDAFISGSFTMREKPCPEQRSGSGFSHLTRHAKAMFGDYFDAIRGRGSGCLKVQRGFKIKHTTGEAVTVLFGLRPVGLFYDTSPYRDIARALVPTLRAAAHRTGLCGPTTADPFEVETPYRTGKEKQPSCHI